MNLHQLDEFTESYLTCALWASTQEDGRPMDDDYGMEDLAPACLAEAISDCEHFLADHKEDIGDRLSQAGHYFWLTRNHHGAGFWDGNWPKEVGLRLTEAAHAWGSVDLYVGGDGLIYS